MNQHSARQMLVPRHFIETLASAADVDISSNNLAKQAKAFIAAADHKAPGTDCPFCGAEVDPTGWLRGDGVRGPECSDCGATAPSMEVWATRVLDQSLLDRKNELITFLHGEITRFESIFKPTNLMLLRGGEKMLELCAPGGKFVGVSWDDMRAVLAAMVAVSPIGSGRVQPTDEEEHGYRCAELEGLIRKFADFDVQNPDHDDWQYLLSQASLQLSDLSESVDVEPTVGATSEDKTELDALKVRYGQLEEAAKYVAVQLLYLEDGGWFGDQALLDAKNRLQTVLGTTPADAPSDADAQA